MNNTISFKVREVRLLKLLHKNAPEPVSRKTLLEEIWGWSFRPATNVTDVAIYRLRRKLDPFDDITIVTSPNKGYRLDIDNDITSIGKYLIAHGCKIIPAKKVKRKKPASKPVVSIPGQRV